MTESLKGALIGAVAALVGAVIGSAGTYLSQRALESSATDAAARGAARVLRQELQARVRWLDRELERTSVVVGSIREPGSHVAGEGQLFPAGPFASVPERARLVLSAPSISVEDKKLIASRLSRAEWTRVAAATLALDEAREYLRYRLGSTRRLRSAGDPLSKKEAGLREASELRSLLTPLRRRLVASDAALGRLAEGRG